MNLSTKEQFVRQKLFLLVAGVVLMALCLPEAWAGVTCQIIPSMCPPPPNAPGGPNPVPEPGTLALLVAGAGAVAAGLRNRRKKP